MIPQMAKNHDQLMRFMREVSLLTRCEHPNIVGIKGYCGDPPMMLLDFATNGALDSLLHNMEKFPIITDDLRSKWAKDICEGLVYLHTLKPEMVIHRDLKSANVLLFDEYRALITDFGMSRIQNSNHTMTAVGSMLWMAPELLVSTRYDSSVDVYAYGIVLWETMSRQLPYDHQGISGMKIMHEVVQVGTRPLIPSQTFWQPIYLELMKQCMKENIAHRPNVHQIKQMLSVCKQNFTHQRLEPSFPFKIEIAAGSFTFAHSRSLSRTTDGSTCNKRDTRT